MDAMAAAFLTAPFTRRAARELLFAGAGLLAGALVLAALLFVPGGLGLVAGGAERRSAGHPGGVGFMVLGALASVVAVLVLLPPVSRLLAGALRGLADRLLTGPVPAPPTGRWRSLGYVLIRVPVAILDAYAVFCWLAGPVAASYPFWWPLFRNHPPGVRLDPVPVYTPFGAFPVASFPGTFAALAAGAAMLLAAPWIARVAGAAELGLMRAVLGPGRLAQRVRDLEETRARAVDDTAVLLRRVERDLHDGAQVRLAALAMNLGRAREKMTDPTDLATARELVDAAHRGAKDALAELRDLVRGIHPPVLDNGLPDALATLAAGAALPVRLAVDVPVRPSPAIETIAYFCAAELLANAVKHSRANAVDLTAAEVAGTLRLTVADDGVGGADPALGTGLGGLAGRVGTVDGRLRIASPPGGPTEITVVLPMRAGGQG